MRIRSACRRTTIAAVVLATATLFAGCGADSPKAAGGLSEDTLVTTLAKAMRAKGTAHVALSLAAEGQGIKAAGDVAGTGARRKLQATFTGKEIGGKLTLRNIGGTIYAANGVRFGHPGTPRSARTCRCEDLPLCGRSGLCARLSRNAPLR